MFYKLVIDNKKKIKCNTSCKDLKKKILEFEKEEKGFIDELELECVRIKEGDAIDFNITAITFLVSFASLFISVYDNFITEIDATRMGILLIVGLIVIPILLINLHMKKTNAIKLLHVISKIKD